MKTLIAAFMLLTFLSIADARSSAQHEALYATATSPLLFGTINFPNMRTAKRIAPIIAELNMDYIPMCEGDMRGVCEVMIEEIEYNEVSIP